MRALNGTGGAVLVAPLMFFAVSPSSFVVDDVSYSCAEKFLMAEKARLFQDHHAEVLITSSPDPSTHKHINRDVGNFDNMVWDRVREDAVLAGTFPRFSQKPIMKHTS